MNDVIIIQMVINNNSKTYLSRCLRSIQHQTFLKTMGKIDLRILYYEPIVYEKQLRKEISLLASERFKIYLVGRIRRSGFGENHNEIRKTIKSLYSYEECPAFLILNPDTVLDRKCVQNLWDFYQANRKTAGLVEARQFPAEHPKDYNQISYEVDWCSGACTLIDAKTFDNLKGFDEIYVMYLEDVDLSWRVWLNGMSCYYIPSAICGHATGLFWDDKTNVSFELEMTLRNHLILIYKFFGRNFIKKWLLQRSFFRLKQFPQRKLKTVQKKFNSLKGNIKPVRKSHPRVKIINLGLYHDLRRELL